MKDIYATWLNRSKKMTYMYSSSTCLCYLKKNVWPKIDLSTNKCNYILEYIFYFS